MDAGLEWLNAHSHEDTDKELWTHQSEALASIKGAIQGRKQKILVSMATGSGKTRLAMALVYQLLESGYADRILFTPDTEQLERDALQAFQSYDPSVHHGSPMNTSLAILMIIGTLDMLTSSSPLFRKPTTN